MGSESKIGRERRRKERPGGMETTSLNNILRQCKERLLGHYRRSLTILAIWLGQCYVSGLDSPARSPPISPFFPGDLDSLPSPFASSAARRPTGKRRACIVWRLPQPPAHDRRAIGEERQQRSRLHTDGVIFAARFTSSAFRRRPCLPLP